MSAVQEELLNRMIVASQLMHSIVDLQTEASSLSNQYSAHIDPVLKQEKPIRRAVGSFAVTMILIACFPPLKFLINAVLIPIGMIFGPHSPVSYLLGFGVIFVLAFFVNLIFKYFFNKKNADEIKATEVRNNEIDENNLVVSASIENIRDQLIPLQQRWATEIAPWYPMDYDRLDAVDFFVTALRNQRASSIGELVNLYETEGHRRRMEAGQREMIAHQRVGNMLQLGSLVMQGMQYGQMQQTNNKLNEINVNVSSAATSAAQTADVANRMANKLNI